MGADVTDLAAAHALRDKLRAMTDAEFEAWAEETGFEQAIRDAHEGQLYWPYPTSASVGGTTWTPSPSSTITVVLS